MTRSLVTGGAGFIGSHVVRALLKRGDQVRVLDDFSSGKLENLSEVEDRLEIIKGSLVDASVVLRAIQDIDYIFHLGAIPSVPRSVEDPLKSHHANVTGTLNILWAIRQAGKQVKRIVYSSSSSVYGDVPTLPKKESMALQPLSPYAVSKLSGEYYCSIFSSLYGVSAVSLRYFNVFGPRQDPLSLYAAVVPRFITRLLNHEGPYIYGDGRQTRDFTYVDDVVEANLLAANASQEVSGKVYNIAGGRAISLRDLLAQMQEILKTNIKPIFEPARAGDVRDSLASIEEAKKDLDFHPKISLSDGLNKTIEYFSRINDETGKRRFQSSLEGGS